MKATAIILTCVFSVMLLAAPVEAAAKKKTTQQKKITCSIKVGKFGKLNIKF